jgi:MoxR-like ATPase
MQDRKEVVPVDLLLLKHLLWGELDEIAPIRKVVVRSIFSGILKAIGEIKASMKDAIHRHLVRKAANEVARDNIDRDKKIFDLMYYHVCDHDTGNTYIHVSDYQQLPFQRQGSGINQTQGLSHPDSTDNKRTILRSSNPTGSMEDGDGSLPEGWRHIYLERDKNHIYINGVQFEIEKLTEGEKQKLPDVPIKQYDDFYCKIENISDGIGLLRKQFESSPYLSPEDISETDGYIKILNKEISKLRMEMQKLDEYE